MRRTQHWASNQFTLVFQTKMRIARPLIVKKFRIMNTQKLLYSQKYTSYQNPLVGMKIFFLTVD